MQHWLVQTGCKLCILNWFSPICQFSFHSLPGHIHLLFNPRERVHLELKPPSISTLPVPALIWVLIIAPVPSSRVSKPQAGTRSEGGGGGNSSLQLLSITCVCRRELHQIKKSLIVNATPDGSREGKEALRSALISLF